MHRFYLDPTQAHGPTLTLSGGEAHHALTVLRIREHERVVVLDGAGNECLCQVDRIERKQVLLKVLQRTFIPPLPCRVTLAQAVTKAKSMDLIVQKATELGIHRLVPILSERSVSQIEESNATSKLEKWHAITIEAIKQCGSPWRPHIEPPQSPHKFLSGSERFELMLIASLQPGARHPRDVFRAFWAERRRAPRTVCVWVGPEGDFTPAEMNTIQQAGALPISLGPLVLRSDTAAVYALSIVNYELQASESGLSPAQPA